MVCRDDNSTFDELLTKDVLLIIIIFSYLMAIEVYKAKIKFLRDIFIERDLKGRSMRHSMHFQI